MKVYKIKDTDIHVLCLYESKNIPNKEEKTLNLCIDANEHYYALRDDMIEFVTDLKEDEEVKLLDGPTTTKRKTRKKKRS